MNATATTPALNSTSSELTGYVLDTVNTTATALMGAAFEEAKRRVMPNASLSANEPEWTGIGLEWFRSLLGRREWTLPCVDVKAAKPSFASVDARLEGIKSTRNLP
ncbi:hypothetical protein H112_01762 [Trichophyton rubrum D6]|nr:hypothetical protein H112_01762 [Trichophyton rubrum D6]